MAGPTKVKRNIKSDFTVLPADKELEKPRQYKFEDPYWSHKAAKHLIVTLVYPNDRKATASIMDNDGKNPDYKAVLEQFGEKAIDANTAVGLKRRDDHIKKRLQRKESEAVRRKQEMLFGAKLEAYEIPLIKNSEDNEMKKLIRKAKSPLEVQTLTSILLRDELIRAGKTDFHPPAVRRKQEMLFGAKMEANEIPLIKNSGNNEMKKLIRKAKSPLEVQTLTSILLKDELIREGQLPAYRPAEEYPDIARVGLLDRSIKEARDAILNRESDVWEAHFQNMLAGTVFYQEYKGIHVDIWYDALSHLAGQHVWHLNTVYKVKKDQKKNTKLRKTNVKLIAKDILLYKDKNMTDDNLEYATELAVGDMFLYDNQILSLHEDDGKK